MLHRHAALSCLIFLAACSHHADAQVSTPESPPAQDQWADPMGSAVLAPAATREPPRAVDASPGEAPTYAAFSALLSGCVRRGVVDYAALAQQEPALDACLAALAATDTAALDANGFKAFWINAYNAFTLKLILEHFPKLRSIKDIDSDDRWEAERWVVGGRPYSLDTIEHKLLRPLGDPRIHFAIVCASVSCPDLQAEAYEPATLDEQLDRVTRGFLADTRKGLRFGTEPGVFFGENHRLYLSALFDWFGEDFARDGRTKLDFVLRFAPQPAADFIRAHRDDLSVQSMDYDWSLNDR